MFSFHNDIVVLSFREETEILNIILKAGILTSLPGEKRLPEKSSGILFVSRNSNLQQRDCSGLTPDSLLIAMVCEPFSGAKIMKLYIDKGFC